MPQQTLEYFENGRMFREAIFMLDSSSQRSHNVMIANCLRHRMTSRRRPGPDLGSFINIEISELGQWNKFLHFLAVGMVGSGLTQCDVASRLGVMSGNTPDLNPPEHLRGILQQELKK